MKEIDDILAKHFSGQSLLAAEKTAFEKWKAANKAEYTALEKTMQSVENYQAVEFDTTRGWEKMAERIATKETRTFTLKPILKYAIAASIAILIGFTGFQLFKDSQPEFILVENTDAIIKTVTLPDGSEIDLNSHTSIEYAANFETNRQIKLNGKAFFNVERDENNPFKISTPNSTVTVLGTSFLVNTANAKTQVDVKTGLVSLASNNKEIKLAKNESAWADGQNISPKAAFNINELAWKTGVFNFNDTPITTVIEFLESFFGDMIDLEVKKSDCTFTGTFDNQEINDIIEALTLTCNLELSRNDDRFILE